MVLCILILYNFQSPSNSLNPYEPCIHTACAEDCFETMWRTDGFRREMLKTVKTKLQDFSLPSWSDGSHSMQLAEKHTPRNFTYSSAVRADTGHGDYAFEWAVVDTKNKLHTCRDNSCKGTKRTCHHIRAVLTPPRMAINHNMPKSSADVEGKVRRY